ncbi:hypothetical protein A2U01_0031060, partial [Trifolium medium]|nr:hypothetical protein [Trifolium medium]
MKTILEYQHNIHIAPVYYNHGKPNLFRIYVDVIMSDLKHQLNSLLHYREQRRVTAIKYRRPSVYSKGIVVFTNMKLQNDVDVKTIFSIFYKNITKGPIELDAKL